MKLQTTSIMSYHPTQKLSRKVSQTVEVNDLHTCPSERNVYLSNYMNKEHFVTVLAEKLEMNGFYVLLCPSNADTTIVKIALDSAEGTPVTFILMIPMLFGC